MSSYRNVAEVMSGSFEEEAPGFDELEFPWWLPWGSFLGATAIALEAARHRLDAWGSDALVLAGPMLVLAVLPFLVDLASHYVGRFLLPRLPWAALTLIGTTVILVDSPTETDFAPFLVVLLVIQAASTARLWETLLILGAASGIMIGLETANQFDGALIWVVGYLAGFAGGFAVHRSVQMVMLERAAVEARGERAAAEERQRIAREIHDVIAHSLSVTMLHLTGARRALETDGDTDEAADALRDAERLGRQAMTDIRRTVGLLRPDAGGEHAPMPGAGDIPVLCDSFARAGVELEVDVRGEAGSVSLATGLGLYRIAQEALSNAARHAPGARVKVTLDASRDPVHFSVVNGSANGAAPVADAPDVGGLGLKGIRERARLLGGTCDAGPEGGGWAVRVAAPRDPEPV